MRRRREGMAYMVMESDIHTFSRFAVSKRYDIDSVKREVIDKENGSKLPYDTDSKIRIYEDRQRTWFFGIADRLREDNEAGFVILMVAVSYLEGNQQYRDGKSSDHDSTPTLRRAMDRIFPNLDVDTKNRFIEQVRQGFFHDGITRKSVYISRDSAEALKKIYVDYEWKLIINPHKFLDVIKNDFENYVIELKRVDNYPLRSNFETFWDFFKGI